jgi:diamine N-acetyltransferase
MLKGNLVTLRALEPQDIDVLYNWENDDENWKISSTLKPFSKNLIKNYIENEENDIFQTKQIRFIITLISEKNISIGTIDLFDYDPYNSRIGLGILIAKEFRNNGFAREAISLIIEYCFNLLNIHQIFCHISEINIESIKLFQSIGFKEIGVIKDWIFNGLNYENVIFFQLRNKL